MSLLVPRMAALPPYRPGGHAVGAGWLQLNSSAPPYPPSGGVAAAAAKAAAGLNVYNDPDCLALRGALARRLGLAPENVMAANGSDQALYLSLMAFADAERPVALPDLTYSYYDDFAFALGIPLLRRPLREDFTLDPEDYLQPGVNVLFPNPNAPTGLALSLADIRRIAKADEGRAVIVDEAYVDFGAETALPLIGECPNLLITRTFSKSGSLAGGRLGFALGSAGLIADLARVRSSVDLYGVSSMAQAAGIAACREWAYYEENCCLVAAARDWTRGALRDLGCRALPSLGNFLFVRPPIDAARLHARLKERRILVRRLSHPRASAWLRISIGTQADMRRLVSAVQAILEEERA